MTLSVPDHVFDIAATAAQESSDKVEDMRRAAAVDTAINTTYVLAVADGLRLAAKFVRSMPAAVSSESVAVGLEAYSREVREKFLARASDTLKEVAASAPVCDELDN